MLVWLTSCVNSNETVQVPCVVDSVQHIGIGHDNTLQVSPYWKIHLKENNIWMKSNVKHTKGDTIIIDIIKIKNPAR